MSIPTLWKAILISVFFPISVFAQLLPERDPQALTILADSLQAMGGIVRPGSPMPDAVVDGKIQMANGTISNIRILNKGGKQIRYEIDLPAGPVVSVINQGLGYRLNGSEKEELPSWTTKYQGVLHIPAFSLMNDYLNTTTKVVRVGTEQIRGLSAFHVRLSVVPTEVTMDQSKSTVDLEHLEDLLSEFHAFIDQKSRFVLKTVTFAFSPEAIENRTAIETYYSDYRLVQDLWVPYRIERFVGNQKLNEIVVNTVSLNIGVPDSSFQDPN